MFAAMKLDECEILDKDVISKIVRASQFLNTNQSSRCHRQGDKRHTNIYTYLKPVILCLS